MDDTFLYTYLSCGMGSRYLDILSKTLVAAHFASTLTAVSAHRLRKYCQCPLSKGTENGFLMLMVHQVSSTSVDCHCVITIAILLWYVLVISQSPYWMGGMNASPTSSMAKVLYRMISPIRPRSICYWRKYGSKTLPSLGGLPYHCVLTLVCMPGYPIHMYWLISRDSFTPFLSDGSTSYYYYYYYFYAGEHWLLQRQAQRQGPYLWHSSYGAHRFLMVDSRHYCIITASAGSSCHQLWAAGSESAFSSEGLVSRIPGNAHYESKWEGS